MDVNSRVAAGQRHHLGFELEIGEGLVVAGVEKMRAIAVRDKGAIFHLETLGVLVGLPAVERLTIEKADPAFLLFNFGLICGSHDTT